MTLHKLLFRLAKSVYYDILAKRNDVLIIRALLSVRLKPIAFGERNAECIARVSEVSPIVLGP